MGVGGYALVFAAYDPVLDRHVALKVFRDPYATTEIRREALALARIHHPNVIELLEIGEAEGLVFLVLDLVRGETLGQFIRERHDWREVVAIFVQAARGLAAVHDAGFTHGDVKPDNILIGVDGRVQIADLGRARAVGPDRLADQLSLSLALWEALHGAEPTSIEPAPARIRLDVPRHLLRVLRRGLAVFSRDCWKTMTEFAKALGHVHAHGRLGAHVRRLRNDRGLTQEELAERAGMAVSTIGSLERGTFSPSFETLCKVADGLRLTLAQLFEGFDASRDHPR